MPSLTLLNFIQTTVLKLFSLQYLSLSDAPVTELPEELKALIPENSVIFSGNEFLVWELLSLKRLNVLSIILKSFSAVQKLMSFQKFQSCTQCMELVDCDDPKSFAVAELKHLEKLGGNPDLAGEFLCNKQANTSTSSVHTSAGEARGKESSKSSNSYISENSFYGNGKSRVSNTKWHLVSGRTVSSFLGKDYVKPAQPANGTFLASKPLKLDPREFRISALSEKKLNRQSKDDHLQKDMEDFLFKLLGEGFQLYRDVIQEIVVDMKCKSMSKLIDRSAETLGEKTKFLGKSSEKENPNTNEGELLRHPKDRNELRKEVFAALFSAAEKSDEFPEITVKTEWRSNALGKVVSEPPEELVPEYKANVVHWQQDDQTYNGEEDCFQATGKNFVKALELNREFTYC
ncbi:putative nuclear RNA export factor SDE5 [Citrus sinensis]|nr:putative nuclear RNA export factor SDE5 [Citrus sinensis]